MSSIYDIKNEIKPLVREVPDVERPITSDIDEKIYQASVKIINLMKEESINERDVLEVTKDFSLFKYRKVSGVFFEEQNSYDDNLIAIEGYSRFIKENINNLSESELKKCGLPLTSHNSTPFFLRSIISMKSTCYLGTKKELIPNFYFLPMLTESHIPP